MAVFGAAVRANFQCHGSSAVVTEFTAAGRFSANRADGGLALDFALPDGCGLACFVNISFHRLSSRLSYINFLSRCTFGAKPFILVPAMVADKLIAGRTAVEMWKRFIAGLDKCLLVFLLPLWAAVLKALADDICRAVSTISDVAESTSKQTA